MEYESDDAPESKLVITRDGSHTVYSSRFDQHYHNPNGAVAESRYVFFKQTGLIDVLKTKDEITILETGFGTGLNLMLLIDYYLELESDSHLNYISVEGFPLDSKTVQKFNYGTHLNHPEAVPEVTGLFGSLSKGINEFTLLSNISVRLFYGMFDDFHPENIKADYIFHDAFSPDANPDLWTGEVFKKLRNFSSDEVILSTYCAASKARGALASTGWKVARAQGALGKREMTLATLSPERLGDLKRVNEERLAKRYKDNDF
ncbi:MAG TPA: tRNA (5-methylaminomethyl-2-thiouridine)(34)-methyltransferase MnmD [Balneolaceae bacterium]